MYSALKHGLRRLALSVICLTLLSGFVTVSAETHYKPHISIGGRAGMSMARMSFTPSVKQSWLNGTAGAVTFRYAEEKLFGIIGELGWTQRGWKENFEGEPFSYSRTLTYLQLPVMTHIYFGSRRFKCFVNLGPEFSYMISDNISADFDYRNLASVEGFPVKNRTTDQLSMDIKNKFDYGITAGVGIEYYIRPRHSLTLEGRFYYGLGNIYPSTKADVFSASRSMALEITLGYNFRLK